MSASEFKISSYASKKGARARPQRTLCLLSLGFYNPLTNWYVPKNSLLCHLSWLHGYFLVRFWLFLALDSLLFFLYFSLIGVMIILFLFEIIIVHVLSFVIYKVLLGRHQAWLPWTFSIMHSHGSISKYFTKWSISGLGSLFHFCDVNYHSKLFQSWYFGA